MIAEHRMCSACETMILLWWLWHSNATIQELYSHLLDAIVVAFFRYYLPFSVKNVVMYSDIVCPVIGCTFFFLSVCFFLSPLSTRWNVQAVVLSRRHLLFVILSCSDGLQWFTMCSSSILITFNDTIVGHNTLDGFRKLGGKTKRKRNRSMSRRYSLCWFHIRRAQTSLFLLSIYSQITYCTHLFCSSSLACLYLSQSISPAGLQRRNERKK